MSTRKRKKKEEQTSSVGITAFLFEEKEKELEKSKTEIKTTTTITESKKVETTTADLESMIIKFIQSRGGKVSKDELMGWAKIRGIKPAQILKVIDELSKKKMIVRRIIDETFYYELRVAG